MGQMRACSKSVLGGKIRPVTLVLFISTISLLWNACGFWSLTNCGCGLHQKKKPHPAWVFLRKMPEKQSILFAWPNIRYKLLGILDWVI